MWTLALACAFFILIHILVSGSDMRQQLISTIGQRSYFALFSLLSLVGFFWMLTAFYGARGDPANIHLWEAPFPVKILAFIVNFVSIMLIVVGALSPSPTGLAAQRRMPERPVSGIIRVSRHPVLSGIALLSAMHLITADSLAAWVFFGSLLALSLLGASSIDRRREQQYGETYRAVMKATSILPFAAIIEKRTRFEAAELGIVRVMVATSCFTCLVVLHELLFLRPAL